jgi:NADPH2:quinone reductase
MHAPAEAARCRQELFEMFVERRINPYVSAVYGLSDVARALNDMRERRVIGKVIIDPRR